MLARSLIAATLATSALLFGATAAPASAESALWTMVASPLTVPTGSVTTFTLTATNEDPLALLNSNAEIGCIRVTVPTLFDVQAASVQSATTGATWSAGVSGQVVTVRTSSGGDRLALLDSVRFTVTAAALSPGELAWGSRAYRDQSCGGAGALLGLPPLVLVVGAVVTPTPVPTPVPTPLPTPSPTPSPAPLPSVRPSPSPTATLGSSPASPSPVRSTPQPSSSSSGRPSATPTAAPSAAPGEAAPSESPASASPSRPESGPSSASRPGRGLRGALDRDGGEGIPIALGSVGVLGAIDLWIVPGLLYGIPGLLIIAFILLQLGGAAAWLPAIRRLRGDDRGPIGAARP